MGEFSDGYSTRHLDDEEKLAAPKTASDEPTCQVQPILLGIESSDWNQ